MSLIPVEEQTIITEEKVPLIKRKGEPIFKGNTFIDDGTQCVKDKEFTKKVKFTVSKREVRESSKTRKNCTVCNKEFLAYNDTERRCTRCCRGT